MTEIAFRRLERSDFDIVREWLNTPHVFEWWGAGSGPDGLGGAGPRAATREQVEAQFGPEIEPASPTHLYVILFDGRRAGLIQWYLVASSPEYAAEIGEPDAAGIDVLIGDPADIDRGLGSRAIRQFVDTVVLADGGVDRVVAGPNVRNHRSVRAFEKAGFRWVRDAIVTGEPAPEHVMALERATSSPGESGG